MSNTLLERVVYDIDNEALPLVRRHYPTATKEGPTFDWSFWLGDKVVAKAEFFRRSREHKWLLTIYKVPRVE